MHKRLELYAQITAGTLTTERAAAGLGLSVDEVRRGVEAYEMARVMLAQDRAERTRSTRRRFAAAALAAAVGISAWSVAPAWAQVTCAQTLPAPLTTFCPNAPAIASAVNANFAAVANGFINKTGGIASLDVATRDLSGRNEALTGTLSVAGATTLSAPINWGTTGGQMLNLYTAGYGIGIQNSTLYNRTSGNFGWFLNGAPSGGTLDPGGGTLQMALYASGDLSVPSNGWGSQTDYGAIGYSNPAGLTYTSCPNGQFVCGVGVGHIGGDTQYWTGARIGIRCCAL